MLYHVVRERQLKNESIAILFPQNRQVFGFAQGLMDVGIEVEVPAQRTGNHSFPGHDFSSPRPKLMAFHSAKGLTFDSVFMPRMLRKYFPHTHPDRIERLIFMAITRATKWCYFSSALDDPLPLLQEKLVPLAKIGQITLLEGMGASPADFIESEGGEKEEGDLDFL